MVQKQYLTSKMVDTLPLPTKGETWWPDKVVEGLGVRCTPTGMSFRIRKRLSNGKDYSKTYSVPSLIRRRTGHDLNYRSVRMTYVKDDILGAYLDYARLWAAELLFEIDQIEPPFDLENKRQSLWQEHEHLETIAKGQISAFDLVLDWLDHGSNFFGDSLSKKSARQLASHFPKGVPWRDFSLEDLWKATPSLEAYQRKKIAGLAFQLLCHAQSLGFREFDRLSFQMSHGDIINYEYQYSENRILSGFADPPDSELHEQAKLLTETDIFDLLQEVKKIKSFGGRNCILFCIATGARFSNINGLYLQSNVDQVKPEMIVSALSRCKINHRLLYKTPRERVAFRILFELCQIALDKKQVSGGFIFPSGRPDKPVSSLNYQWGRVLGNLSWPKFRLSWVADTEAADLIFGRLGCEIDTSCANFYSRNQTLNFALISFDPPETVALSDYWSDIIQGR